MQTRLRPGTEATLGFCGSPARPEALGASPASTSGLKNGLRRPRPPRSASMAVRRVQFRTPAGRRWAQWLPLLMATGCEVTATAEADHRQWFESLRRAGITVQRIKRLGLDDPRMARADRERLLQEIISDRG